MKNILAMILSFVLLCGATACGTTSADVKDSSTTPDASASIIDSGSDISVANFVEYVPDPGIPNLIGHAPKDIESWSLTAVSNYVPFTPDGYEGPMADISRDYTGKDGKQVVKTYHVAFLTDTDREDDYPHDSSTLTEAEVNGELQHGIFLMNVETLYFLECRRLDDTIVRYFLDIDLPSNTWYGYVLEHNDDSALICTGSYIFVYKFDSKSCEIITKDALDYNYEDNGKIYFTDWLHDEYVCDWNKSSDITATGQKVIRYEYNNFSLVTDDTFTSDFEVMQSRLRDGTAKTSDFDHLYTIYSFGNIYNTDGRYLSNIHFPKPYVYNRNSFFAGSLGAWISEGNIITFYRYGDFVRDYDMGDGLWKIIEFQIDIANNSISAIDTDDDGLYSAKEVDKAIQSIRFLLYNVKDHCIYIADKGKKPVKVAEDVVDYCEAYGELYWMNGKCEAYELSWREKDESVLIGVDVVGISHHTDERAGFVVAPGDPRCNATSDGFSLCTLYGDDWLNQEQTSGAWALEHTWDQQR